MILCNRGSSFYAVYRLSKEEASKIGFLDYVSEIRAKGETMLFPEVMTDLSRGTKRAGHLSPSAPLSKWFNHFIESVNRRIDEAEHKFTSEHVLHSFRHTVRTEFRRNRTAEDVVCRICRWDNGSRNKSLAHHSCESDTTMVLI